MALTESPPFERTEEHVRRFEADGFVIVPEASEGHPQGAPVTVYLYEGRCIDG